MSDVLLPEINLSSNRSTGLFILTIDSQYNATSEIIPTWNLRNDLYDICANFLVASSCLSFLGSLKSNAHTLRFAAVSNKTRN